MALVYFDRALAACPSHSLAWLLSSPTLSYIGRGEQAVRHAEHALRLSPLDRSLFYYYALLGFAYYAIGNYVEAVKWASMGGMKSARYGQFEIPGCGTGGARPDRGGLRGG